MKYSHTISPSGYYLESLGKKRILGSAVFLSFAIMYATSEVSSAPTFTDMLSLFIIALTSAIIFIHLTGENGGINLDLTRPLAIYGFFYFLYYLFPYMLFFLNGQISEDNKLIISFLMLIGYLSWYAGVRIGTKKEVNTPLVRFSEREAWILLILCIIGIGLIIYTYAWRTSHGIFFNQARHYEQELSVASSFRDVFVFNLQLPVILFLGLLSAVQDKKISLISHRLLISYGAGITMILAFSSQTRPALTAMIFILIAMNIRRTRVVKLRHIGAAILIGMCIVAFIQGVRAEREKISSAENQFAYALKESGSDAIEGLTNFDADQMEGFRNRVGGNIMFLSEIIDVTGDSGTFLYGKGFTSAFSIVPRFLWPDKPAVVAPDLVVMDLLGIPQYDATLGPLVQFYVEGGVPGVIIGYALFGWFMGVFTRKTVVSNNPGLWIFLFLVWSHISNLELELLIGGIITIRNAFMIYLLYKALIYLSRSSLFRSRFNI